MALDLFATWYSANQHAPGTRTDARQVTAQPATGGGWATAAPAPVVASPTGTGYRPFDLATRQFYEANPQQAWRQFTNETVGSGLTPFQEYARGQYQNAYASYLRQSETNPQMTFTDSLKRDYIGDLRKSFASLTPNQKGYNIAFMPAGRYTG